MEYAGAHQGPDVLGDQLPLLTLAQVIERVQKRHAGVQHVPCGHHLVDERSKRDPGLLGIPAAPDLGDAHILGNPQVGHTHEDAHLVNEAVGLRLERHPDLREVHLQAVAGCDLFRA